MNTILKNKVILFILFAVLVCVLLAVTLVFKGKHSETYLSEQKIEELRLDYPIYNKSPELITMKPLKFQEVMERVDSIVIGSIDAELPNYHVTLPLESESDKAIYEKNKSLGFDQKEAFIQYKLKVEKLVAGAPVDNEIILAYNAMFKGIEPDLKTGMKLLLGVAKGNGVHEGKYSFTRYGTFYIVEEDYVLPAYEDNVTKKLTGASLEQLITTIKSYRND